MILVLDAAVIDLVIFFFTHTVQSRYYNKETWSGLSRPGSWELVITVMIDPMTLSRQVWCFSWGDGEVYLFTHIDLDIRHIYTNRFRNLFIVICS